MEADGAPKAVRGNATDTARGNPRPRWRLHLLLYLATFGATYLAGGASYAVTLMTILTFHEAGHYLAARRYRIPASLPYFVPFPFSVFGTMGAVITMPARIPHRRALLDVGAAGPIAGFVIALPALILGTRLSHVATAPSVTGDLVFGDNLVVKLVGWLFGPANPHDDVLVLHPIGFAGYVGCLVTAFNLIPVGQLDGGHVLHAWLGRRPVRPLLAVASALAERAGTLAAAGSAGAASRIGASTARALARLARFAGGSASRCVGIAVVAGLLVLGTTSGWNGWLVWAGLLLFLGVEHPPTTEEWLGLDPPRVRIAVACAVILALTFIPVPARVIH